MTPRILLVLALFVLVVGGGAVWFFCSASRRKRLLENLLSLPKERRFFWYLLRKAGFRVIDHQAQRVFTISRDGEPAEFSVKADFIARKGRKKYICLFNSGMNELNQIKEYFAFTSVFEADGIVFFHEGTRLFTILE